MLGGMAATCAGGMLRAYLRSNWAILLVTAVAVCPAAWAMPEAKLSMFVTAFTADSLCFAASDMGVQHFEWNITVENPTYPYSPKEFKAKLHMYVKYTHWQGDVHIKGFLMADTRDAAKPADGVKLEPTFTLRTLGGSAPGTKHSFPVSCQMHSYWDPPKQAAMVYGFEHTFPLSSVSTHEYELSNSLDKAQVLTWRPYKGLNLIDGRGCEVAPITQPSSNLHREAYVILKPLYNFNPAVYGPLIERHMEYYQALGVEKHVIYLRRESIPQLLLGNSKLGHAATIGKLLVVEWDGLAEHDVWHRQYDQRMIYSHAMLVFTTMDVLLLSIDLDEFLVTSQPNLQDKSIQEIIQECAGDAVDVRIQRHHTVCKACDRDKPEAVLWTGEPGANHPLSWYHLINYKDLPKRRSIMNPNFVRAYYIHYGTLHPESNATYPEATCMSLLHIANLVRVREEADLVEANYVEDHSWMGILRRFKQSPSTDTLAPPLQASAKMRHLMGHRHGQQAYTGVHEGRIEAQPWQAIMAASSA